MYSPVINHSLSLTLILSLSLVLGLYSGYLNRVEMKFPDTHIPQNSDQTDRCKFVYILLNLFFSF